MKKLILLLLCLAMLCGCSTAIDESASSDGTSVIINGKDAVTIEAGDGDVTISRGGTYLLSGTLNGTLIIETSKDEEVTLILDNATIDGGDFAAIYIKEAGEVSIVTKEGSENLLTSSSSYTQIDENNVDATVYSKGDLEFAGEGLLIIEGNYKHAAVSKDDLKITSGTYRINAISQGLSGKDSLELKDADVTISCGTKGLVSGNEEEGKGNITITGTVLQIESKKDAISAAGDITVNSGTITLNAASKAIDALKNIYIYDGKLTVDSGDDGFNAGNGIYLEKGSLTLSSVDDAIHADIWLIVKEGTYEITAHEGLEAEYITVLGGEFLLNCNDDGINASGADVSTDSSYVSSGGSSEATLVFEGGDIEITTAGDGIDTNGSLLIKGGEILVNGSEDSASAALDFETSGMIKNGKILLLSVNALDGELSDSLPIVRISLPQLYPADTSVEIFRGDEMLASAVSVKSFSEVCYTSSSLNAGEEITLKIGNDTFSITAE